MKRKYNLQVSYGENKSLTCIGPECVRPAVVHQMCNTHYCQLYRGKSLTPIGQTVRRKKTTNE